MTRHRAGPAAAAALAAALLWPAPGAADHDRVPDPPPRATATKLAGVPRLDRAGVTVSGLSSGGFFAHQFHIAFSGLVQGAGIVAGGPFGCVEAIPNPFSGFWSVPLDRLSAALVGCTHYYGPLYWGLDPAPPRAADALKVVRDAFRRGLIDDPANLADDRVWLFHGRDDAVVPRETMEAVRDLYAALRVPEPRLEPDPPGRRASHGLPVARFAGESRFPVRACEEHAPPYVIECGFDAAEALLRRLLAADLKPPSDDAHRDGALIAFDQTEFFDSRDAGTSLSGVGYVYVPARCGPEPCRLHVAFHGCKQNVGSVHDDFIRDGGYNRWAASNNLVVLYPQTTDSAANPNMCWDFWGYAGPDYYARTARQMRAVKAMIDRLLANGG